MPHFIIFEITTAFNNDFQADCSDLFRCLIGLSIPKVLCFVFVWGIMGKCELFSFVLKIILLRHKVGLCLHGHIFLHYIAEWLSSRVMRAYCLWQWRAQDMHAGGRCLLHNLSHMHVYPSYLR